jgi:hypothetical protein
MLDYEAGHRAKSLWNADIPNLVRLVRDPHILMGLNHVAEAAAQRGNPDLVEGLIKHIDPRGKVPDGVIRRLERIARSAIRKEES